MKSKKENEKKEESKNAIILYDEPKFDTLNKSIEALGNNSKELNKDEKELGFKVIDEWKYAVTDRIEDKARQINGILKIMGVKSDGYCYSCFSSEEVEQMYEKLAELTETELEYKGIKKIKLDINEHHMSEPHAEPVNPDLTIAENDKRLEDYAILRLRWETAGKRLQYQLEKRQKEWLEKVRDNETIRQTIEDMMSYLRKVNQFKRECKDKSQLAKINLVISNASVREAIKEMLDFSKTL